VIGCPTLAHKTKKGTIHARGWTMLATKSLVWLALELAVKTIKRKMTAAENPRRINLTHQDKPKKLARIVPTKTNMYQIAQEKMDRVVDLLAS
jgi:hypothetical protein